MPAFSAAVKLESLGDMETKTQSLLLLNWPQQRSTISAQPYFVGMPHHPVHPPFLFSLTKMHGDYVMPERRQLRL